MIRLALGADAFVARTRPAWLWVGQVAIVWLGIHLAADRLDDVLASALAASGIPWPEPEQPLVLGTWAAVALEVYAAGWAAVAFARASAEALDRPRAWLGRATPHAVVAPLFWLPTSFAGAWVLAMAAEDLVAPVSPEAAAPVGWVVGGLVALRLALPGVVRVVGRTPVPGSRWDGAVAALPALAVAALAVRYGLPVWGWLP